MTERIPGRVGPHRESHEPRLSVELFATTATDEDDTQIHWDGTKGITDWLMLGNDQYGDCGAAATDHAFIAQDGVVSDRLGTPKYPGTLATYFAYGVAQGEPGPTPDQGVDNATWLSFLYQAGIIDGYAEVPVGRVNYYGQLFSGCLLGLYFDGNLAIAEFRSGEPWSPMARKDGHDVLYIATDKVVTWGKVQDLRAGFLTHNATDAWVILDADDRHVDWPSLEAALQAVHGILPEAPISPTEPSEPQAPTPVSPEGSGAFPDIPSFLEQGETNVR